jgi:membrane associated rhomboid family serine protease
MEQKNRKKRKGFRITYNAPVTLTFSLLAALVLILDGFILHNKLLLRFFVAPGCQTSVFPFTWTDPLDYLRLFTHVLGHRDWNHLLSNLSFILLLGPLLEERYGSPAIALMIAVTAFVTGILNACFISSPLMGSSGIAFMMILLASFTSISHNEIPLSFILILLLYIGRELIPASKDENISTLAHIAGGICGSMFGFLVAPRTRKSSAKKTQKNDAEKNKPDTKNDDATIIGTIDF